jgi:hypothetical protein
VRKLDGARSEQGVLTSSPSPAPPQPVPTFGPFPEGHEALRRLTNRPQGWEYDIVPGHDLGPKRLVWISRRGLPGSPAYQYEELPDMTRLPELLGC